jgi:hypothetical protein
MVYEMHIFEELGVQIAVSSCGEMLEKDNLCLLLKCR